MVHSRGAPSLSVHFRSAKKTTSLSFATLPPPLEGFSGNRRNSPRSSQFASRHVVCACVHLCICAWVHGCICAFVHLCMCACVHVCACCVAFLSEVVTSSDNLRENFGTRHVKLQSAHLAVWRGLPHSLKKHPQQNCGLFGQFCRPAALWSTQKLSHNYPKVTWLFTKS